MNSKMALTNKELIEINREVDELDNLIDLCDPDKDGDQELIEYYIDRLRQLDKKIQDAKIVNLYQIKRQSIKLVKE